MTLSRWRENFAVLVFAGPFGGDDMPAVDAAKKDHEEYVIGKWIIELAELDALTREGAQRQYHSRSNEQWSDRSSRRGSPC